MGSGLTTLAMRPRPASAARAEHADARPAGLAPPMARELALTPPKPQGGPSAVTAGLKLGLLHSDLTDLAGMVDGYRPRPDLTDLPRLLPELPEPAMAPFRQAFGPLAEPDARRLSRVAPGLQDLLATPGRLPSWDLWLIYENDGRGIVRNLGSGYDQGRTRAVAVLAG